ncbi:hypothetical protein [Marinobacter salexigens]|jgi:hypothetical protein|uniref:Uncharacterized protein n=1 Tax=Marinobacter salexigens TaxID=1925763 RepID=A0ABS6AA26_9GAMM|nr:hypothetical protein [Marinobacter salexigens]MBU2875040.1 hypothetical protein [Marinobacter salexigens]
MARNRGQDGPIEIRLISLFASLFFSVPTAAFVWLWVNLELAVYWDGFLSSRYLIFSILGFAVLALLLPRLFPSILGSVWRGIAKVWHWWGW